MHQKLRGLAPYFFIGEAKTFGDVLFRPFGGVMAVDDTADGAGADIQLFGELADGYAPVYEDGSESVWGHGKLLDVL
jgi:hypothetical protein